MSKHSYGYLPDPKDERDFIYSIEAPVELPTEVDNRVYTTPVRDQGNLGSCTGFSMTVGLREFMTKVEGKYTTRFSPLYLYYKERELEDSIDEDAGAYIRDGLKVLKNIGCCRESYWPYKVEEFKTKPSVTADQNCLERYKIKSYTRLNNLIQIKTALHNKQGVVLGFTVYDSFEEIGDDGIMPMPKWNERKLGGHAVFCVGYSDTNQWLIVKNSWGTEFGDKGYFYMPYEYVEKGFNVSDIWTAD
jgi:C1A family cysteine protease